MIAPWLGALTLSENVGPAPRTQMATNSHL